MIPATILLVEDDEPMLIGISELLLVADIGYDLTVLTAGNGLAALEIMNGRTPDLIISDINMPRMDGIELLAHLRQHAQWLYIPVIFLTAKGSREDIHRAKASGVDLYITKPFDSNELIQLVKSQLNRAFQLIRSRQQVITSLKGDILQILNHELNTPLTYVMAYSELLLDTHENLEDLSYSYDFLRGIQAGCLRLTNLVTDFIQVIELRAGETARIYQQNLQLIEDIEPILIGALEKSQSKLIGNKVQASLHKADKPLGLWGNPEMLQMAFERLFDNALKFTFSHKGAVGQVNISLLPVESELKILIQDEGMGLPEAVHQHIFDLFYQYNRKEYEQQGTGTGLTIAQELVHLHNGRIEVESTLGQGSLFTAILPLYNPHQQEHPAVMAPAQQQATVLIVEDDPNLLNGLEELLDIFEGKYRLNTFSAINGEEGLIQLSRRKPHLIISDIMMPKMGGIEFLAQVRQIDELVQVPFIFLTAKGERRDVLEGILSGAEEYITKPYDSDKLLDLVVAQLDKYFQRLGLLSKSFEELKGHIIQLMSKDFHGPIEVVAAHTQEVLGQMQKANTDDELKNSLEQIRQGSSQLSQLVKYFIALAELTTDEAQTVFDYQATFIIHPTYLLEQAASALTNKVKDRGVAIQALIKPNLSSIFGVENTISDCICNIGLFICTHYLDQANKVIQITAEQIDGEIHIGLSGNKPLPEEQLSSLQELIDRKRRAKVDLTGHDAVLQIVQGHITLHNGRIQLSNHPNFTITLIIPTNTAPPN